MEDLRYRMQYVIAPGQIDCPFRHDLFEIGNAYQLYAHPDLNVVKISLESREFLVLGEIFDFRVPVKGNEEIARDLIKLPLEELLVNAGSYTGRYVLIYKDGEEVYLIHDNTASRKVFYGVREDQIWAASQSPLLARMTGAELTRMEGLGEYYSSPQYNNLAKSNVGSSTRYSGLKQLMPNHYLKLPSGVPVRYWPKDKLIYRDYKEVAREAALMISGFMESIVLRHKVMIPVTAGKDSRILLAASRNHLDRVMLYVNMDKGLDLNHPDISIPRALCDKLGLKFTVLDPRSREVDDSFRELYYENNPDASEDYLPHIYNYYKNFSDRINIPGNIASAAFEIFKSRRMKAVGYNFARLNGIQDFPFAVDIYDRWVEECQDFPRKFNVNLVNLFYWEERLGNWGTQVQLDKDIAQEDINLFNSRNLASLFLSVNPKYIQPPYFPLHMEILKILWPETLSIPVNPSRKNNIMKALRSLGVLEVLFNFRYSRFYGYR